MAVPEQIPVVNYVADGIVKKFDVPFEYDQQSDLHIYVDGVEPTIDKYFFADNAFNFYIAPSSGQDVKIKRITPKERDTDYNLHTNTVRPKALNTDFDRLWYVLQEVFSDVGGLSQAVQDEIIARIQGDEDLLNQLTAEISARMLGDEAVTEDLKNYVNQVVGVIINDPDFDGIDADKVNDASGETQQQTNYNGGSKWHSRVGGYKLNERVILTNGDIVKSTIDGNTNDPNVDMTGWVKTNSPIQIVDESGKTQQEINNFTVPRIGVDSIILKGSNNATIDTSLLSSAISTATITGQKIEGLGLFKIDNNLNFRNLRVDFTNASIEITNASVYLNIGGNAATTINKRQSLGRVFRTGGASATVPTIRVSGTKDQFFDVQACDYLQIYADTTVANVDGSIAYCTFNLGKIDKLEITNNPANTIPDSGGNGGAVQWINENHFYIQRCSNFIMSGTYHHNHNHFYGGVFEGASSINFLKGRDNYFHNLRFEGSSATVEFAADTERNTVLNTWDSSIGFPIAIPSVTDNGFDNNVIDDFFTLKSSVIAAYTDISKPVVNNLVNASRAPQLQRLLGVNANSAIAESEMIPAVFNDWYRWVSLSNLAVDDTNARYRAKIEFYDSKLNPVTANANFIYTTGGVMSAVSGNSITSSGNVNAAYAALLQPALTAGVRFIKVKWLSNNPVTAAVSNAQALYVTRHSKLGIPFMSSFGFERPARDWIFTAKPTQGFVTMGASGFKSDGTEQYICTFALETSISSLSGASLVVTSATGVQVGDVVGINLDDLTTHWSTVSAVSGSTITLSDGATSAASIGSRVAFNRWVTK